MRKNDAWPTSSVCTLYGADYYLRMRTSEAGSFEHRLGEEGMKGMLLLLFLSVFQLATCVELLLTERRVVSTTFCCVCARACFKYPKILSHSQATPVRTVAASWLKESTGTRKRVR